MSGKKFCRLCLNEVFVASTNMHSSDLQTKDKLMSIFPEMNVSLTKIIRLCEECFQKVNFVSNMNESFMRRKRSFQKTKHQGSTQCCKLGFTFDKLSNTCFPENNNCSSGALTDEWNTALSKPDGSTINGTVCSICISWVTKIYRFKRQCFRTEENLQLYCSRKNLTVLEDRDLQNFLDEQYFLRTVVPFSESAWRPESVKMYTELSETLNEQAAFSMDLGVIHHEECVQLTGEVVSNLNRNSPLFGSNVNFEQSGQNCSSQNLTGENDVVLVLSDDETNLEDKIDVDELNLDDNNSPKRSEDLNDFETDDVFIDHGIRNSSSVPIIVLDDDDDGKDIDENNGIYERNSARNIVTEENLRNVQHYQAKYRAPSTSYASQEISNAGSNEENYCSIYSDIGKTSDTIGETRTHVDRIETYVRKSGVNENLHCPNNVNQILQPSQNPRGDYSANSVGTEGVLNSDLEDTELSNSSYEFFYNSFHNNNDENSKYLPESHVTNKGDNSALNSDVCEDAPINDRDRCGHDDVIVVDDDCIEAYENISDTIDLTSDDTFFGNTQDVERRELNGGREFWGCYICVAILDNKKTMKKHLLNHEEPWNKYGHFQCNRCPFRARWKGSVTRHKYYHSKRFHNRFAGKQLRYICPYCNVIYLNKGRIQSHMNDHIISWKEYNCADCMFTTNLSRSLKSHYQKYHCKRRDPSFCPNITDVN